MKIIPIENIRLTTELSMEEIFCILKKNIRSEKVIYSKLYKKQEDYFIGTIDENYFKLKRVLNNRFSLLPIANGIISNENKGVNIELFVKPNPYSILILVLLMLIFSTVFIILLYNYFTQNGNFDSGNFSFLSGLGFAIILLNYNFKSENREVKN